ncbi:phosphate signaling complex protein PhoU [Planctomicrobium sp. SH664]|uniref:phosphate signaling complex protein PhoU n=1 Tax=Planctomicrobium sp. SH664 TaxID=3448125 RepID=UPI003F5C586B
MSVHMQNDLAELHRDLLSMCARVEDMIHRAVAELSAPDYEETRKLIAEDIEIDRWDVRIEDACLKILALYQPVAIDLRRITTVMKISGELERVADLAVNIAERASSLLSVPQITVPDQLKEMAERSVDMLHRSIDAYVDLNNDLARQVCRDDDAIDEMNRGLINQLIEYMHRSPEHLDALMHLFSAVRHVERVADHATNIAEDVVYLVEGRIIRHIRKFEQSEQTTQ